MKVTRGRQTLDLVPLAATDYLKLEYGDEVYDSSGARWKVKAVQFSKTNPKSRELSLKHGLHAYDSAKITNGRPAEKLFKTRGTVYATAKSPKAGLVRGTRVVSKVPLTWGNKTVEAGMRGTITEIRTLSPAMSKQFHRGEKALLSVKWNKGGTFMNVYPSQVRKV